MGKTSLQPYKSCSMRKTPPKKANVGKMRASSKQPEMATMQRLQPMQNTQFERRKNSFKYAKKPLYKHFRVVLCKKRFQKAANIGKMKAF